VVEVAVTEPYWDPYNSGQRENPYESRRRPRDEAPVYRNDKYNFWALSRFADVLAASLDTETFSSARGITLAILGAV
jgi:cytochrome P450